MNKHILLGTALSLLASGAFADEIKTTDVEAAYTNKTKVEATRELKQSINLGFANTTGNSKTMNINGKYTATFTTIGYNDNPLKVAFDAAVFYDENDDTVSNEEYTANLGLEQYLTDGWLGYGSINWLRNPDFRNYDSKLSVGFGAGKVLYDDGKQSFKVKLGVAYNIENYADNQPTKEFASLNEYAEYNNRLNDVSRLFVKFGAQQNLEDFSDDYELTVVAGLRFAVAENINVSIEEEIAYDHLPPAGFDTTDTKSIVRIGYNF